MGPIDDVFARLTAEAGFADRARDEPERTLDGLGLTTDETERVIRAVSSTIRLTDLLGPPGRA